MEYLLQLMSLKSTGQRSRQKTDGQMKIEYYGPGGEGFPNYPGYRFTLDVVLTVDPQERTFMT